MNADRLRHELFYLLGFLLTSACGLYEEPASYGPRRLIDAARQLLFIMQMAGLGDTYLVELRQGLDRERFGNSNDQRLQEFLHQVCLEYAAELKQRVPVDRSPGVGADTNGGLSSDASA
ncbi:MAG: hypothetical protein Kow0063_04660 [Anaerolineae bacterium]